MKRTLLFFVFAVVSIIANAQWGEYIPFTGLNNSYSSPPQRDYSDYFSQYIPFTGVPSETVITGETYNAVIFYESSTGHENTYELPVIVNNGTVLKLCFNNGGSVHAGNNNSGYTYYGGKLQYVKDIEGYATVVKVVYSNKSWQQFTIVIE